LSYVESFFQPLARPRLPIIKNPQFSASMPSLASLGGFAGIDAKNGRVGLLGKH
jgi:hypothetical protein